MYRLEFVDDLGRHLSIELPEGVEEIVVGRDGGCDVVLTDPSVSRRHAMLRPVDEGVEVRDLGSNNGVWVRGERLTGVANARLGDELVFGSRAFVLGVAKPFADQDATADLRAVRAGNTVTARFMDGRELRGSTLDLGGSSRVHITTADGEKVEIDARELKALYFHKPRLDPGAYQPRYGRKVLARFTDGEVLIGASFDYDDDKDRFFVFPLDRDDPHERVWVNAGATAMRRVLGVSYGMERDPDPIVPGQKERNREAMERITQDVIHETAVALRDVVLMDAGAQTTWAAKLDRALSHIREEIVRTHGVSAWREIVKKGADDAAALLGGNAAQVLPGVIAAMNLG